MAKKILVWATNRDHYANEDQPTGLWLGELTHFVDIVTAAGWSCDLASPLGGKIPLDPRSLGLLMTSSEDRARLRDATFMEWLNTSLAPTAIDPSDYAAVYYTGGHGTMWDFPEDRSIAEITRAVHERGGVVAAVCHGVGGLLALRDGSGQPFVAGRTVTGYSDVEEVLAGVKSMVPFSLQQALADQGATYEKATLPFVPYVQVSERLLTGQNPQSTKKLARKLLTMLEP